MDIISSGDLLAKGLECTASPLSRRRFENCCCDDGTHVCIYVTVLDDRIYIHIYGHFIEAQRTYDSNGVQVRWYVCSVANRDGQNIRRNKKLLEHCC